jgi:predicted DNA-binding protein
MIEKQEKQVHLRVTEEEWEILEQYAKKTRRSKSDIIREFMRSLASSGALNPTQLP